MPKIFEYLGITIMFYSNEHEPIHVHGKYQGFESKIDIILEEGKIIKLNTRNVKGKRALPNKELKEFKFFVEKFKNEIIQKWIDYFIYHKSLTCIKIEGKVK